MRHFLSFCIYLYASLIANFLLKQYGRENEDTQAVCMKLKQDLQAVFNVLPKDMQQLLIMNPERASLLQESHECSDLPEHTSPR